MQEASKLELVRNSALAAELTADQCGVLGVSRQVDGEWHNIHVLTKGDLAGESCTG